MVSNFWSYYDQFKLESAPIAGTWAGHTAALQTLAAILDPLADVSATTPGVQTAVQVVEAELRTFFQDVRGYGPLSKSVHNRIAQASRVIRQKCTAIERALTEFVRVVNRMPAEQRRHDAIAQVIEQFREIKNELVEDLNTRRRYEKVAEKVAVRWQRFVELRAVLTVQSRYRPALKHLDRLSLNDRQEQLVEREYEGHFRIQGASGSGKTIVLLHRALRLARENPSCAVRVFTINRALAELLRASVVAIHGSVPENLHVAALYDFLCGCLALFDFPERFRLVDDRSGSGSAIAWRDFFSTTAVPPPAPTFLRPPRCDVLSPPSRGGKG